ncbi:MAG: CAP domain-containing protein, partial [Nitrososphaera sp.]|nr:CAP domain-containing protein [Nitrososphaera sp.]
QDWRLSRRDEILRLIVLVGAKKMDRDTFIVIAVAIIASLYLANTGLLQIFQEPDGSAVTDAREALFSMQDRISSKVVAGSNAKTIASLLHHSVNEERRINGLDPLMWDPALSSVAYAHSKDMATRGFIDHRNPDGHGPNDRAIAVGYDCFKTSHHRVGENIQVHGSLFLSDEEHARRALGSWMASEGHRDNILREDYSVEGIGAYLTVDNFLYITQVFC